MTITTKNNFIQNVDEYLNASRDEVVGFMDDFQNEFYVLSGQEYNKLRQSHYIANLRTSSNYIY